MAASKRRTFHRASDLFPQWKERVLTGEPPTLYPVGTGELARLEVGKGNVTLIGGAPGAGKTAFVMQCVISALRLTESLRACVCNVEMSTEALLDRQLARISGVNLSDIRHRRLSEEHGQRLAAAFQTLEPVVDRLCFVKPPFELTAIASAADAAAFNADLVVLDYIQRITPPNANGDKRSAVDATMNYIRRFADQGMAVIVVAAVSRTRDRQGQSTYAGSKLNLASFRESSELEFGADDAFILVPEERNDSHVVLRHLKSRNGQPRDIRLRFDRAHQQFTPVDGPNSREDSLTQGELTQLWDSTAAATETEAGAGE